MPPERKAMDSLQMLFILQTAVDCPEVEVIDESGVEYEVIDVGRDPGNGKIIIQVHEKETK